MKAKFIDGKGPGYELVISRKELARFADETRTLEAICHDDGTHFRIFPPPAPSNAGFTVSRNGGGKEIYSMGLDPATVDNIKYDRDVERRTFEMYKKGIQTGYVVLTCVDSKEDVSSN